MKDKVNPKSVTLAIHPGKEEETDQDFKKDSDEVTKEMADAAGVEEAEIKDLNSQIRRVYKNMKNLLTECKMSMIRQDAYTKAV